MRVSHIEHGKVRMRESGVLHLYATPDIHIFELDLDSKHPGWFSTMHGSDSIDLMIWADENKTLRTRDTLVETRVTFDGEGENMDDWSMVVEGNRYTVKVVLYRTRPSTAEEVL